MRFKNVVAESLDNITNAVLMLGIMSVLVLMTGCNSLASKHTLYEGKVANAATILSSETVQVSYVDNRDVGVSFVGQVKEFSVLPGQHTLIIEYADFWSPTTGDDEKVTSRPVKVTFTAEPNQTYQLGHKPLATLELSKAFAKEPLFFVKNAVTGEVVKATYEASAPKSFMPKLKFESTPEYQFASDVAVNNSAVNNNAVTNLPPSAKVKMERLQNLKQLWKGATKEERAAFLQWITSK